MLVSFVLTEVESRIAFSYPITYTCSQYFIFAFLLPPARSNLATVMSKPKGKPVQKPPAPSNGSEETEETTPPLIKGSRSSHTHRKKGEEAPDPVKPPTLEERGQLTLHVESIIQGGPKALISAQRGASAISKKFGIDFEAKWLLFTPYLENLMKSGHRSTRLRARYAIRWRPRYLAALAVTGSKIAAARAAQVHYENVVSRSINEDPDFASQVEAAKEYCKELLKARMMQRALEGDCEPILYMGVPVAWVKKFDSRLQIEMARALMPQEFKTPGSAPIVLNDNRSVFVMDAATLSELQQLRKDGLAEKRAMAQPVLESP